MVPIDELFEEEFTPVWMQHKQEVERMRLESLEQAIQTETNYKFKCEAYETVERISRKCDGSVYTN